MDIERIRNGTWEPTHMDWSRGGLILIATGVQSTFCYGYDPGPVRCWLNEF